MDLAELSVQRFAETVASDAPAPGGGSVAALEASIGAALTGILLEAPSEKPRGVSLVGQNYIFSAIDDAF